MEVGDRFAAVGAVVDDDPEAVLREAFLLGDEAHAGEEVAEEVLVGGIGLGETNHRFPGNEQKVDRGLGVDITETQALIVLVNDLTGDLAIGDLLEDGFFSHGARRGRGRGALFAVRR